MEPVLVEPSASVPEKNKKPLYTVLVVLVLLAALVALSYVFLTSARASVLGVHILAVENEHNTLYTSGVTKLEEDSFPSEGMVTDYAQADDVRVALVLGADGSQSVVVDTGKEVTTLYTSATDLSGVAVSPDGMIIAFAERTASSAIEDARMLASWTVHIRTLDGGTVFDTPGYAPHFFMANGATHVLVTAAGGLTVVDPQAGTAITEAVLDATLINRTASISPKGEYVVIPDASLGTYTLYGVTSLAPLRLSVLWSLDADLSSVAWHDNALLGIAHEGTDTKLIVFKTAGTSAGTPVYTLPSPTVLYRLTP